MGILKRQLAEQILRIYHGGDVSADAQMDERELFIGIDQARSLMVRREIDASEKSGNGDISGDFISSFEDVVIKKDAAKDLFFSEIPVKYIVLKEDKGLYQVSLMQDQTNPFVRIANGAMAMYRGLHAFQLGARTGYWVEKDRIYYHNFPTGLEDAKVLMKLVASVSDFAADEEIPIPADKEFELVQMVLQMYGIHKEIPQDKHNDNVK